MLLYWVAAFFPNCDFSQIFSIYVSLISPEVNYIEMERKGGGGELLHGLRVNEPNKTGAHSAPARSTAKPTGISIKY
jgi:hypothetical protein